jgi:hypothetical protein
MLKGWHKTLLRLAWPVLRRIAALGLALSLIGIKPSTSVLAAPRSIGYDEYFLVTAIPSTEYVCTGDFMYFTVSISKQLVSRAGDTGRRFGNIRDVWVVPQIGDTNVVSTIDTTVKIGSAAANSPTSARVWFKAGDTPGETTVKFSADISHYYTGADRFDYSTGMDHVESLLQPVFVRECTYQISMVFIGLAPGIMSWAYEAEETTLDKLDNQFDGEASFNRVIKILAHDRGLGPGQILCSKDPYRTGKWTVTTEPTMVVYSADLTNGKLYLTATLRNYKDTVKESCTGSNATSDLWLSAGSMPGTTQVFPPEGGVAVIRGPVGDAMFIVTRVPVE